MYWDVTGQKVWKPLCSWTKMYHMQKQIQHKLCCGLGLLKTAWGAHRWGCSPWFTQALLMGQHILNSWVIGPQISADRSQSSSLSPYGGESLFPSKTLASISAVKLLTKEFSFCCSYAVLRDGDRLCSALLCFLSIIWCFRPRRPVFNQHHYLNCRANLLGLLKTEFKAAVCKILF